VTSDAVVAAWFALNGSTRESDGRITFAPIETLHAPSLYVYLQEKNNWSWPVLDLGALPGLGEVALRTHRQKAFFLPHMVTTTLSHRAYLDVRLDRSLSAIIKLHFHSSELRRFFPNDSAEYFFPRTDALYGELYEARLPALMDVGPPVGTAPGSVRELVRGGLARVRDGEYWPRSLQAESPNSNIAYKRVTELLKEAAIPWRSSQMGIGFVCIGLDSQQVPPQIQARVEQLGRELSVTISFDLKS
jgi:hypothetical protein